MNEWASDPTLAEIVTALRESGSAVTSSLAASTETDSPSEPIACALCRLVSRSIERSLKSFFSEFVNDPEVRIHFRRARGFCREHTPFLTACGDALGIAILYADLADETRNRWRTGRRGTKTSPVSRWFPRKPEATCPACTVEAENETRYATTLAAGLRQYPTLWHQLEESRGLCVDHVELVARAASPADASRLVEMECLRMDELHAELLEIVRKNDYRFRGEAWGSERDAWRRALVRLRRK